MPRKTAVRADNKKRKRSARFIAGEGREKGGSAGGLLALAIAIENKLSTILARRCDVSLGAGAALRGAAKFLRVA